MPKKLPPHKMSISETAFNTFFSDQADWFRFWLCIGVITGFIVAGAVFEQFVLGAIRWALIPISLLLIVWLIGASYIQDIYEVESYSACLTYLWGSIFGFPLPVLRVSGGKINKGPKEVNVLSQIGGPGVLLVEPGKTWHMAEVLTRMAK
jgi:hypothetical protein